jgi:aspartyl-tRNA synthetase
MHRSHTCGELRKKHDGKKVTLSGWINRRRDHGDLIFIDLRDRYGRTQLVIDPSHNKDAHIVGEDLRPEFVVKIEGTVRMRPDGQTNKDMDTGAVEVLVDEVEIISRSETPPFEIDIEKDAGEDLRLKYRYLDLRRDRMKRNMIFRHKLVKTMRDIFDEMGFLEVETPMLMKGTPEGSREYIVPARLYPENFYVLPQSPQQLKQLLMVGGIDKYFQIARCFRDEDTRGDRQPEFTQLDMEMSFATEEDVMDVNEKVLKKIFEDLVPEKKLMHKEFPRFTWHEAMGRFGSDKPDIRFEMELLDMSEIAGGCEFQVFKQAVADGGVVKSLTVESEFTRKEIDELTELVKVYGAKGLAYLKVDKEGISGPIAKFFGDKELDALTKGAKAGSTVFFAADTFEVACTALGQVRLHCGDKLELRDKDVLAACWVVDFPLFAYSEEEGKLVATHHPFTDPKDEDLELLESEPAKVLSKAFDVALNGNEIGGGSMRIHSPAVQEKVFAALGISSEDVEKRFGHMIEAFKYGAPPHGGIALGLDRLIMILLDEPNIREVIAFPKDSKAKDMMTGAPSELPAETLKEMNIKSV